MRASLLAIAFVALVCCSLVDAGTRVPQRHHRHAHRSADADTAAAAALTAPQLEQTPWLFEAAAQPEGSLNATATPNGWVLYKQCGQSWSNDQLGTAIGTTICDAGCAMSSVAMVLKTKGANMNPGTLNKWLRDHGGYASRDLIIWGAVDKIGHVRLANYYRGKGSLSVSGLASLVSKGNGVVVNVRNGGHWVLVTGHAGGDNFYVNDPGFNINSYAHSGMSNFVVYA